jgi:hypothetical protein
MDPFHSTFASVWLERYRVEWVNEEEYSLQMLNHPARKIISDRALRSSPTRSAPLSMLLLVMPYMY